MAGTGPDGQNMVYFTVNTVHFRLGVTNHLCFLFLVVCLLQEVTTKVDQATNHFLNIPTNPVMHCIDTPSFNGQLHDPVRVKELGELLTKVAAGVDAFLFVVKSTRYR